MSLAQIHLLWRVSESETGERMLMQLHSALAAAARVASEKNKRLFTDTEQWFCGMAGLKEK